MLMDTKKLQWKSAEAYVCQVLIDYLLRRKINDRPTIPKRDVDVGSGMLAVMMMPATFVRDPAPPAGAVPEFVGSMKRISVFNEELIDEAPLCRLILVSVSNNTPLVSATRSSVSPNQLLAVSEAPIVCTVYDVAPFAANQAESPEKVKEPALSL